MAAQKKTTFNRAQPKKKKPTPKAKKGVAAKKTKAKPAPKKKAAPAKRSVKKAGKRPAPRTAKRPSAKRPAPKKKVAAAPRARTANPEGLELARAIAAVASDKKASDIVVLDLSHKSSSVGYDFLVLASGDSDVQLDALKNGVEALLDTRKRRPSSVESSPDWVCLNLDDVVAHFFTPDKRQMYDLEGLWSDATRVTVSA